MALKLRYSKAEEIPAPLAENCVQRDGAFVLDVEGVVERAQLEFDALAHGPGCSVLLPSWRPLTAERQVIAREPSGGRRQAPHGKLNTDEPRRVVCASQTLTRCG